MEKIPRPVPQAWLTQIETKVENFQNIFVKELELKISSKFV